MEMGSDMHAFLADRFRIDKHKIRQIFVDETLVKIDGLEYWLWVAYEPNMNVYLMMHLSRERTIFVCDLLYTPISLNLENMIQIRIQIQESVWLSYDRLCFESCSIAHYSLTHFLHLSSYM
jgi:hypothetical protein